MFPHLVQRSSFRILIALTLSFSLLSMPVIFSPASEAARGQESRGKPRLDKPEGELPDLEEVQRESGLEREAFPPIPSTVRSPKVPLEPWNGRRVGDSEPPPKSQQTEPPQPGARVRRAHARKRFNPPPPRARRSIHSELLHLGHGPVNRAAELAFLSGTFLGMAQTTIHELLHHAGFGDRALANTVAFLLREKVSFANSWEGTFAASKYWDKTLQEHCH